GDVLAPVPAALARLLDVQHRAYVRAILFRFGKKFRTVEHRPVHVLETQGYAVLLRDVAELPHAPARRLRRDDHIALQPHPAVESVKPRARSAPDVKDFAVKLLRVPARALHGVEKLRLELGVERVDGIDVKPAPSFGEQVAERRFVFVSGGKKNFRAFSPATLNDRERILGQYFRKKRRCGDAYFHHSSSAS